MLKSGKVACCHIRKEKGGGCEEVEVRALSCVIAGAHGAGAEEKGGGGEEVEDATRLEEEPGDEEKRRELMRTQPAESA